MKILVLLIIIISLYLIYRLSFPKQAEKPQGAETPLSKLPDGYEAVVKSRFVLPSQSNSKQHDDRKEDSDKQDEKADIFAAGNEKKNAVISPEELGEVFDEDVNPEELDIEPDENEADEEPASDADEEAEEIRQSVGAIEGYAGGFTYDELATVIHEAEKPGTMTEAVMETLRDLSQTDMFEKLVSGDTDRAVRIASVLDRSEQSLAGQNEDATDDKDNEYGNFDIANFLS
ncbi:MAG: hypothetical protein EZS26_003116 [Candidatus Ordinivivax streblomastigis]|uniref:Conjugal transfer protein TraD n=1 Tax=Candidatus Ordinivivax streblomastigis TaxID=2540710 RepID=A0A5M8NUJ1_9BACT|nr:MAG: hypothetical protein EZS26_003116 [Candidatus Ordinivivax streblomastigis]